MVLACEAATATAATTTSATMDTENNLSAMANLDETPNNSEDEMTSATPLGAEYEFDETQCLFCNQTSPDVDQNLAHMSKAHGLYVDQANLLVDVDTLLAYFHLVISGYYECLYCGTQRNTRQAAQQHMMAKGHCKYDISDKDAELRDFYDLSSDVEDDQHHNPSKIRFSDDPQLPSWAKSRKHRPSKRLQRHSPSIAAGSSDQSQPPATASSHTDAESAFNTAEMTSASVGELSTRAQKQEHTLNSQLSQLRANDRRSLLHLPASQQRALLATHHKQMEKARRTEQVSQTNLESAGNKFGRLSTIRLIRKPPHTGNIHSLNR